MAAAHTPHDHSAHSDHGSEGSFIAGFTIGMLACVTGYLLARSEGGKELRRHIKSEWEKAVDGLEPLIEQVAPAQARAESGVRQILKRFFEDFVEWEQSVEKPPKTVAKKVVKKPIKRTFTGT